MEVKCSKEEFQVFKEMVREEDFLCSFSRDLLLVLLGVEPGCAANTYWEVSRNRGEIREMGLKIKKARLSFVEIPDGVCEERKNEFEDQFFVARKEEQLEILEDKYSDQELTKYRQDFGLFCEYPEEDVEWFVGDVNGDIRNSVEEYEDSKFEISKPDLVNYVPKPSEDRIRKAEEVSEKYMLALLHADEAFDSSIGQELINLRN